jgi:hypothetical protein
VLEASGHRWTVAGIILVLATSSSAVGLVAGVASPPAAPIATPHPLGSIDPVPYLVRPSDSGYPLYLSTSSPGSPVAVGQPGTFTVATENGSGPTVRLPYTFTWLLPNGTRFVAIRNATSDTITPSFSPVCQGAEVVMMWVNDSFEGTGSTDFSFVVGTPLAIVVNASSYSVLVNTSWNVSATWTGAIGSAAVNWSGLPTGCAAPMGASLACRPSATGWYEIHAGVRDSLGCRAMVATSLIVYPPPSSLTGFPAPQLPGPLLAIALLTAAGVAVLALGPWVLARWLERRGLLSER